MELCAKHECAYRCDTFEYMRACVAKSAAQNMSLCPFCSSRHACDPGDIGGTAYADMAPGDLGGTAYPDGGQAEWRLIEKLFKFKLVRAGAFVVRLRAACGCGRGQPRDIQLFANGAGYSHGILVVHEGLRACFLFRAAQPPQLVSLSCGLRLMETGTAAGFALTPRERLRWLSVSRSKNDT